MCFLILTVPDVLLKVSTPAVNTSAIEVQWEVERIDPQLQTPSQFLVSYCPKDYYHCFSNITATAMKVVLHPLYTYVWYQIKVKAINILTAKDGTKVEIPEGNFSEPVENRTTEGGKHFSSFLSSSISQVQVRLTFRLTGWLTAELIDSQII